MHSTVNFVAPKFGVDKLSNVTEIWTGKYFKSKLKIKIPLIKIK